MRKKEAYEIVRGDLGRRPDFPNGKDYVDWVRRHDMLDAADMDEEDEYDIAILEGRRDAIIGGSYREPEPLDIEDDLIPDF